MSDSDKIRSAIADLIRDEFESLPLIGHVLLLAELHDEEGPWLFRLTSDDMPVWVEIGMLEDRLADLQAIKVKLLDELGDI